MQRVPLFAVTTNRIMFWVACLSVSATEKFPPLSALSFPLLATVAVMVTMSGAVGGAGYGSVFLCIFLDPVGLMPVFVDADANMPTRPDDKFCQAFPDFVVHL